MVHEEIQHRGNTEGKGIGVNMNRTLKNTAKKLFTYENISIFFAFAIITVFSLILVNQFVLNSSNSRSFNNYYGPDCRVMNIKSSSDTFVLDPDKIGDDFSISAAEGTFMVKDYSIDSVRVFYGKGDCPRPPMTEGTFFSDEQLLSEEKLCVVGKIAADRNCIEKDGERYYQYNGYSYRVIGICGEDRSTDLDICVFLNWGGYYAQEKNYSGQYIVDGVSTSDIDKAYLSFVEMMNRVQEEDLDVSCRTGEYEPLIRVIDPVTEMIYIFSGISILFLTMLTAFFFVGKREKKIAIEKLLGFSGFHITFELTGYFLIVSCIGYLFGLAALAVMNNIESFKTTDIAYFASITPRSVVFSLLIIIVLSIAISAVPVIKTYKTDTSSALR